MSFRASELPESTAELVELTNYLLESRDSTMFKLKAKIQITAQYVLFLMNQVILPSKIAKDLKNKNKYKEQIIEPRN